MKLAVLSVLALLAGGSADCDPPNMADLKQAQEQAKSLEEAHAQVGMPAITKFQEKRMMKDIYELRDREIATHAYVMSEVSGCLVYLGPSVGYGIPYATQYSAPERDIYYGSSSSVHHNIPQAEPNGLFMPQAAEGTWILLKDPAGDQAKPVYVEPRVVISPFRLPDQECRKSPAK